jgi:hypothetical protein
VIRIRHITGSAELAPKGQPGSWVSDAEREKFMVAHERAFELWPQPYEEFDIETAIATTRVHAYRPPRRAHQARRPLLVVVLHRRPGLHDPRCRCAAASPGGWNRRYDLSSTSSVWLPRRRTLRLACGLWRTRYLTGRS